MLAQPAFLAHVTLEPHGQLILPLDPEQQYGIFVMHGKVSVDGGLVGANTIALLKSASQLDLVNPDEIPASLLVLGGEPAELPLVYRGAFVYNSHAAAENAEQRYLTGRMGQLAGVPV